MKKSNVIAISLAAAFVVAAVAVIFPAIMREKEKKRTALEAQAMEEAIAAYPKLDEIDVNGIVSLETYEGDIIYRVSNAETIAKVMDTLNSIELVAEYVDPAADKERATGGPVDGLHLLISMKDENDSWFILADDKSTPTDFVIEHTVCKNRDTDWFETKTGYYTKSDKIYGKIKAFMYGGERIDLNELNNSENNETRDDGAKSDSRQSDDAGNKSDDHKTVNLDYNPDTIYTAKTMDFVNEKGCVTKDIFVAGDKIYFCCYKENNDDWAYFDYNYILGYTHYWGYVNKDGSKKTVFRLSSDDPEYPYRGMLAFIGATKEAVYAVTFRAKSDGEYDKYDPAYESKYYVTAFDMSGKVVKETEYKYNYEIYRANPSLFLLDDKVVIFDGVLSLYDKDLNEIALNGDNRITAAAPAEDGNIAVLKYSSGKFSKAILNGTDLKELSQGEKSYDFTGYYLLNYYDESTLFAVKTEKWRENSKIIKIDLNTGDETEIIDSFHSGIQDDMLLKVFGDLADIPDKEGKIIIETSFVWFDGGTKLLSCSKADKSVAEKRKPIKVYAEDMNVRGFNAYSKDYYAEEYGVNGADTNYYVESRFDLAKICRQEDKPDVLYLYRAEPEYIMTEEAADLSAVLAKESDLSEDDFFPGIIKAFTYNGSLRAVPLSVGFTGLIAPSNTIRGGKLTPDIFSEILSENTDKSLFYETRRNALLYFLTYYGNPFYNPKEGIYNFECDDFKNLIKVTENLDWEYYDEYKYSNYDPDEVYAGWLEKMKSLGAMFLRVGNAASFYQDPDIDTLFGKNYEYVGYPSTDGSKGCFFNPSVCVINNLSEEKEGALEFIKYALENVPDYKLPARISTFDKYAEYALKTERSISREYIRKFKEAMLTAQGCEYTLPDNAYDFIRDTLEKYYAEKATLDETARAFQIYFGGKK